MALCSAGVPLKRISKALFSQINMGITTLGEHRNLIAGFTVQIQHFTDNSKRMLLHF